MRKIFILIFGLLITTGCGKVTQAPIVSVSDQAIWKIYNNNKFGFSFKYLELPLPGTTEQEHISNLVSSNSQVTKKSLVPTSLFNIGYYHSSGINCLAIFEINITLKARQENNYSCQGDSLKTFSYNNYYYYVVYDSNSQDALKSLNSLKFFNPEVCAQVLTQAKNDQTGEIRSFSTPCDLPAGWTKIQGSPANIYINSRYKLFFAYPRDFIVADANNLNNPEHIQFTNDKNWHIDVSILPFVNGQGQSFNVGGPARRVEAGRFVWWIDDDNQGGSTISGGRRLTNNNLSNQYYLSIRVDSENLSIIDPKYAKYSQDQIREMEGQEIEVSKIPNQIISSFKTFD
jgi:hypothetical protein